MQIFIDTNVIVKEGFFRSKSSLLFLKAAKFLGIEVIVPEIVIDEVKGVFSSKLREETSKYDSARKTLAELVKVDEHAIDICGEASKYSAWLDDHMRLYNVHVMPYPRVTVREIVRESYKGQKPFGDKDTQYKDFIIWKTLSGYVKEQEQPDTTYFVTNNTKDFCEQRENQFFLHSQLQQEVSNEIIVYTDLRKLFQERIFPSLKVREISDIPELSADDVRKVAEGRLEEELSLYSVYGICGLEFSNEVMISSVLGTTIRDWEIAELDEDDILISVAGSVDVEVEGFIEKHDLYHESYEHVIVTDPNWNEWVAAVSQTIDTPFQLDMLYSRDKKKIEECAVQLINEISEVDY